MPFNPNNDLKGPIVSENTLGATVGSGCVAVTPELRGVKYAWGILKNKAGYSPANGQAVAVFEGTSGIKAVFSIQVPTSTAVGACMLHVGATGGYSGATLLVFAMGD